MNVRGLPLETHPGAFWIVVALMSVVSTLGAALALERTTDA